MYPHAKCGTNQIDGEIYAERVPASTFMEASGREGREGGREERSFASGRQMWFDWSQEAIRPVVVPTVGTAGWSQ